MDASTISIFTLEREGELLACRCGRKYPIVDGVPIVGPEARDQVGAIVERDLAPEVAAALVASGPDDAPYPRLIEHVSIYLDAHWGEAYDRGAKVFVDRITALPKVALAVELGCSAGRVVAALAARADHVVGVELNFGTVRRARHLLDGEPVAFARRGIGRNYTPAHVDGTRVENRTLVCADALDPPLVPSAYDRVVALNVLDSVRVPSQLISVLDGLCAPGGEIIVSSPYAWQSGVVDERERFGGADPAAALTARLRAGTDLRATYEIVDEAEITWTLRRDARTEVAYRVHYLRARKGT
jgi:SAM-dependent methyltransferase